MDRVGIQESLIIKGSNNDMRQNFKVKPTTVQLCEIIKIKAITLVFGKLQNRFDIKYREDIKANCNIRRIKFNILNHSFEYIERRLINLSI